MRIVFIGSTNFGFRCLKAIHNQAECELVGVVTAPRKFSISYRPEGVTNVLHADIQRNCAIYAIQCPVIQIGMKDLELFAQVQAWQPDIFVVCGWYHMVPKSWRDLAPAYAMHASLLPAYSGGAPLVWAMIEGAKETGITLFQMDDGVDSGPIVDQLSTPILYNDTIPTLYARVEKLGLELLKQYMPKLAKGKVNLRQQDETQRRVLPQRSPEDGVINWEKDAYFIDRFIRAQTRPYPGAFTTLNQTLLRIWSSEPKRANETGSEIGTVINLGNDYWVQCGRGQLKLVEVEYEQECYYIEKIGELLKEGQKLKN